MLTWRHAIRFAVNAQAAGVFAIVPKLATTIHGSASFDSSTWSQSAQGAPAELSLSNEPVCRIRGNQGNPDADLVRVSAAFRSDHGAVVLAEQRAQEIRVYDCGGRLVRKLGRTGDGPGEFRNVASVWPWRGDSVLVSQLNTGPLVAVHVVDGGARSIALRGNVLCCFADGSVLLAKPALSARATESSRLAMSYERISLEKQATSLGEVLAMAGNETAGMRITGSVTIQDASVTRRTLVAAPFGAITSVKPIGRAIVAGDGRNDEIRTLSWDGRPLRLTRLGQARVRVTAADIRSYREAQLAGLAGPAREAKARQLDELEYPKVFPPYRRIEVDEDGTIWAEQYSHAGDKVTWILFGPEGNLLGRVAIPANARLLSVRRGHVTVRTEDDDGFVDVAVYSLQRP